MPESYLYGERWVFMIIGHAVVAFCLPWIGIALLQIATDGVSSLLTSHGFEAFVAGVFFFYLFYGIWFGASALLISLASLMILRLLSSAVLASAASVAVGAGLGWFFGSVVAVGSGAAFIGSVRVAAGVTGAISGIILFWTWRSFFKNQLQEECTSQ